MARLFNLGFNDNNERTNEANTEVKQITDVQGVFPDLAFPNDKIESLTVDKLRAGSILVDQYIQSTGFVTGITGWQIKGDGNAEFVGITLTGGTLKYGKTAFTDTVNAGYILDSNGVFIGNAGDTTHLKYTLATGVVDAKVFSGIIAGWTIGSTTLSSGNILIDSSIPQIRLGAASGAEKVVLADKRVEGYASDGATVIWRFLQEPRNNNIMTIWKYDATPAYGNALSIFDFSTDITATLDTSTNRELGDSTSQFDITNPAGTTFRYTWDGTGTDPAIVLALFTLATTKVFLTSTNFNVNNRGTFTVTGAGANYFEITNASGVAESNKTLGANNALQISTTGNASKSAVIFDSDWDSFNHVAQIRSNYGNKAGILYAYNGSGTMTDGVINIVNDGTSGKCLTLQQNSVSNASVMITGVNKGTGATVYLEQQSDGNFIELTGTCNSANELTAIEMNMANSGAGLENAFRFDGSEGGIAPAGTFNPIGYIRVSRSGSTYYMPYGDLTGGTTGSGGTAIYGNGYDGDATITVDEALTRDMYYNNLTINTGKVLDCAGYRIYVKNTLTTVGTGKIQRTPNAGGNGTAGYSDSGSSTGGTGGTAGGAIADANLAGGVAGKVGGNAGAGAITKPGTLTDNQAGQTGFAASSGAGIATGTGKNGSAGVAGAQGGQNGNGFSGATGGAAGAAGTITTLYEPYNFREATSMWREGIGATPALHNSSADTGGSGGGGGGAGRGSTGGGGYAGAGGGGGGSGSAGGVVVVLARNIVNAGSIIAPGGNGGNGGNGANCSTDGFGNPLWGGGGGGGGGGTGGTGGVLVLIYNSLTNTGTIGASGGSGGSGGTGGNPGGNGGAVGSNGTAGSAGATGMYIELNNAL